MMDNGVGRLREFLGAEEKRGSLCNLVDPSGPSDQRPQIRDNNAPLSGLVEGNLPPTQLLVQHKSCPPAKYQQRAPAMILASLTYLQGYQALCMNKSINPYGLHSGPNEAGQATN